MDRKNFIKSVTIVVSATGVLPLATLVGGCSASSPTLYATIADRRATIPRADLPDMRQENSYVRVYVAQETNPIILFADEKGEFHAILSTCSHSGCEVSKRRTKFECPCHGSEYDLHGKVLKGPAKEPLNAFAVRAFADCLEILVG
jgi:Rieske Fe-S protein